MSILAIPCRSTSLRGRPRKYGASHKVAEWAQQATREVFEVTRYGETTSLRIAETTGYLHGIERLVRILAVWDREEKPFFLFTTDLGLTPVEILEHYAARFEEEVTFRDLKQEVGFGDYRLRKETAFTKYLQLTLVAHAILRLVSIQDGVAPQTTPWYHPTGIPSIAQTKAFLRRGEDHQRFFTVLGQMALPDEIHQTIVDQWPRAA